MALKVDGIAIPDIQFACAITRLVASQFAAG
jgi:hypothetical protein